MKIILSRKGFDKSNGGFPSPILPDGTLLSLPIPAKNDFLTFDELEYDGVAYADILRQLRGKEDEFNHSHCHLDPDIRKQVRKISIPDWQPAFGQINSAQGFLRNQQVGLGDLFLFFGWFRQTEGDLKTGTLRFKKDAPDLSVIYGYLQIGDLINQPEKLQTAYPWHPHSHSFRAEKATNMLYLASESLSFNKPLSGSGVFQLSENKILTMPGATRSVWKEIDALSPDNLRGSHKNSARNGGIYYSGIWQEKVLKENALSEEWAKGLFKK
ncbi:hypothetical protein AB3329_00755 [Streptococcus sp. H31]|uniref:Nmad3 family putative nucleotide modification protein n=1 Tax=Streptococcus huangxiaojuni TaxID=3237239 RepID=UPI0034A47A8A